MWAQLQVDILELSPVARSLLPELSRPLVALGCERIKGSTEQLFVVARVGNKALIYDDVEDEYAIANIPHAGPLRHWQLFGPLEAALLAAFG
ncbi:hypothetical protein VI26_08440 [Chromobacterium sp. LK1]|nr:hypothetical protein VI26_08440 [Chromobacterium sp. LK1]